MAPEYGARAVMVRFVGPVRSECHEGPRLLSSRTYVRTSFFQMEAAVAKTKVFVSFDFDNDKTLKDFIIGQAKLPDSPFEVSDHSLKEAAPERDWETKARAAINRADKFIVMLGSKTRYAPGVKKE